MYSFAETQQLFEFLEADLAKKPHTDVSRKVDTWTIASEAIRPVSNHGPLFGLTQKDIDRAKAILDGKPQLSRSALISKRLVDIFFSAAALVLLSPVFLIIGIAIRANSPGPMIYRQPRIGRDGREFNLLKFRSMVQDADVRLMQQLREQGGSGVLFKLQMDPRVTRFGRFIRRYSLDELPQLWNVFRGDMSLVGPRPLLVREDIGRVETQDYRPAILKPGLTGLWAVMGRHAIPRIVESRLDLYYIENWSLIGDFQVLLRTIRLLTWPDRTYPALYR